MDSPEEIELWKQLVPREGMKHEFLIDGLLALASLHLAHLEPSSNQFYTSLGVEYQSHGLLGFNALLPSVDGENVNALLVFSVIITVMAFAISVTSPKDPESTPSEALQSIVRLLRGVAVINDISQGSIRSSMLGILVRPGKGPPSNHDFLRREDLEAAMASLIERSEQLSKYVGPLQHQLYVSCIRSLQEAFEHVLTYGNVSIAIAWPETVSNKLMEQFQQEDPMAQLIWVHYGVLTLVIHNFWWGKGFGVRLINSVSESLHSTDNEWMTYTQWARDCARVVSERAESGSG
ncbi:hypothetical protein NEMBOFW57_000350 [Staphylotrichum longicolle]|uniref:Uncharacterized protein n=1 Tax=Staphylotrichum longicolle TaxID=669026 RepID=A0AAD4EZQ8_9PEZI|nr:hypothetical protein NEMBOFW57_000350 [Staphylotrichum longicolle]